LFEKIKNKIKNSGITAKANYGKIWQEKLGDEQIQWYEGMHKSCLKMHDDFKEFLREKRPSSILEIGCGAGYYPINLKDLFIDKEYVGIDISETAIEFCKSRSPFNFICTDFLKKNIDRKFDLIFSHALIDHVYDIDLFIEKIIKSSNRFVYVTAYRGYFPDLEKHVMRRNNLEGTYYNDVSIKQMTKKFMDMGLQKHEYSFSSIKVDNVGRDDDWQTIIKIEKNNNL
jgi:SAM-dependent methyltransferase|tara:strand:+ start:261 stop:944 length:684 start_codon:yes stop_codon:yes gene_type:complete